MQKVKRWILCNIFNIHFWGWCGYKDLYGNTQWYCGWCERVMHRDSEQKQEERRKKFREQLNIFNHKAKGGGR